MFLVFAPCLGGALAVSGRCSGAGICGVREAGGRHPGICARKLQIGKIHRRRLSLTLL